MYNKETAGIKTGFVFKIRMKRHYSKAVSVSIIIITFLSLKGYAQLIGVGLADDPSRANNSSPIHTNSTLRTSSVTASTYTDTLTLPFFEDFSGIVVPIDSITIATPDSLIKIHDDILNNYPDTTAIFIGFLAKPPNNSLRDSLTKKIWYIKKIAPGVFTIDSSATLTTPLKKAQNTSIFDAYWRKLKNDSYFQTTPDYIKWLPGGNTYINNRLPMHPVSYNVASFDGLQADGTPYNTIQPLATGYSDNLTSLPINLASRLPSDSIYLSYYWQQTGIGDAPETEDYLELQFKDNTGIWNTIQTLNGNIPYMNDFKMSLFPVKDPKYFFKDFQFRFRSYGRLSGPFDVWSVDYIYLNKNRTYKDTLSNDKTIGNLPVSILKRFTSMPYNQFFANKNAETTPLIFTDNNLDQAEIDNQFFNVVCSFTKMPEDILVNTSGSLFHYPSKVPTIDRSRLYQDTCHIDVSGLNTNYQPFFINHTAYIALSDTNNILFANNNRYNTFTVFWDYYAYDDGTPEWGVAANQIGTKVANKFTTTVQDTITDIDIYFTRSKGPNMNGRTILISVWNTNHTLISQQTAQVYYGGFQRYHLNTPAIIGAGQDFYVGYQQNFTDLLSIGYDRNYDHSDAVYFNLSGGDWNAYNTQTGYIAGSMMIRPIFSKGQILITAVEKQEEEIPAEIILYPVPTDEVLKIKGLASAVYIRDLTGRTIISQSFNPYEEDKTIDVSSLSNGLYIIELKAGNSTIIRKIIVQHSN
jgi:hypothetical protein